VSSKAILILYFIALLALVAGGYFLFLWFVVNVMQGETTFGLTAVAAFAGVASFFNPCSFPLLPVLLARQFAERKTIMAPLTAGFVASLGVIAFNLILGVLVGVGGAALGSFFSITGTSPNVGVLALRGIAGALLLFLGLSQITGKGVNFHFIVEKVASALSKKKIVGAKRLFIYGFSYTLLGIGCGGPIFAGLTIFALASGGFLSALYAFSVYAAVMAILMVFVASLVALSKETLLSQLKANMATIKKVSGVILVFVGLFMLLSTLFLRTYTQIFFPQ